MSKKRRNINKQVAQVEKQIFALYGNSYEAAIKLAEVRKAIEAGTPFTWKDNPAAERKVNKILSSLADSTSNLVKEGVVTCWDEGEKGAKEKIVASYRGGALQEEADELSNDALKAHRAKGAIGHSYANASRGGMNISTRVWNLTETAKKELEVMIQNGVLEGKSPLEISREMRGYLNKPNTLFRRVKNKETGELELSKAAKDYHPRRGVYRSAYKNARRLAVTEMNAAYRRAEWESYQSNPLVTGYEIRLSNNHTTTNSKGQRVALKDICDDMAGVYPKTFLWTGWHPQCRCEMIPILVSKNDFRARIRARKEGKLASWSAKQVTKMPKGFTDWVEDNKERLASAGSVPYWVRDNFKNADISKGLKQASKTTAVEPAKGVKEAQRLNDKLAQAAKKSIDYDKANDAMEQYVGGDRMWINQYLRDKSGFGELDGAEMEYLKELTDITSIENVGERVLYRSVDARAIFGDMTDIDFENLQSYYLYEGRDRYALAQADRASKLIGTERIEKGFMSTTKSFDIAADWGDYTGADYPVMMRIKTSANTKGFDVERYTKIHSPEIEIDSPQREMLLARGQKYKITNISKEGRNICVDVEIY